MRQSPYFPFINAYLSHIFLPLVRRSPLESTEQPWVEPGVEMARLIQKLSPLMVTKLTKPGYHGDGAGLWLQVSPSRSKSWLFRFAKGGRERQMGLGSIHAITLAEARELARDCRRHLLAGRDPIEVRKGARAAHQLMDSRRVTFDQCAKGYIAAHRDSWKSSKHAAQWTSTLAAYASPLIGALPVAEVDTALVVKVLSPIWQSKTETASRLRGRIESILDWASTSQYRQGENPARWRGHLENLLAKPAKLAKVVHHPALPWQYIGLFMADLRKRQGIAARAVEFAILTATRSGEVRGATWEEVEANVWTIPSNRMKAGKEHRVPLSSAVMTLLQETPRMDRLIFPGTKKNTALSDMSLTSVLRRMNRSDITIHGFRSTFRDWCAESVANSFPREVCEHALAHSLPDKVEAAYRRGDLLQKRTLLMQAWADYCGSIPAKDSATPMLGISTEL